MKNRFIDRVIEFLDVLYNNRGNTVKIPRLYKMINDKKFKNVIYYLAMNKYIKITWKNEKNRDVSPKNISHIHLTDPGAEYLTNYQNRKAQKEFNRIIALTGAIVALITFYNFLIVILEGKYKATLAILFFIPLILCFVPIVNFIWKEFKRK